MKRFKLLLIVSSSCKQAAAIQQLMNPDVVKEGLAKMADDMVVAGEPVTIDKLVERHLAILRAARDLGLRWESIVRVIKHSGSAAADGSGVSAQHLRASYSRALRKVETSKPVSEKRQQRVAAPDEASRASETAISREPQITPSDGAPPSYRRKARSPAEPAAKKSGVSSHRSSDSSDPSEADLAAVRRRLS